MISVSEAKNIIIENCSAPQPVLASLKNSRGRIIAEDIFSDIDIPGFPQSSMDGYAFNFNGYKQSGSLQLVGEVAAGDQKQFSLKPNEAMRIFTGAPVPVGADTVVMQEKTTVNDQTLFIKDDAIKAGANVRKKGSEIKTAELAIEKDTVLTPSAMGFLAGIGITEIKIYPSPVITIITTGNELQEPGMSLEYGQVYESNSVTLMAALQGCGIENITLLRSADDLQQLTSKLEKSLNTSNIVLLTGGVSVGDYDFVLQATVNCGVQKLFHRVKQKPGKPLFFGKKDKKLVFGLPGNPSSVLTCFYQYVMLALAQIKTSKQALKPQEALLTSAFNKPAGLTHFLKGYYDGTNVTILQAQESYRMSSFAKANCLVEIAEDTTGLKEADMVKIYLLG